MRSLGSSVVSTKLLAALFETLPLALLGMAAGLAIALGLAVLGEVKPAVARTLLPMGNMQTFMIRMLPVANR